MNQERERNHPKIGSYRVRKSKRAKRVSFTIHPNRGVVVTIPYYYPYKRGSEALEENITKVERALKKVTKRGNSSTVELRDNFTIPLIRGEIKLRLLPKKEVVHKEEKERSTYYRVETVENTSPEESLLNYTLYITPSSTDEEILELLDSIIRVEAKRTLPQEIERLSLQVGLKPNRVTLKNNRTNWGSCSSKGNINLNIHLVRLPPHLSQYVILHELAHLKEPNHGKGFYQLLKSWIGDEVAILNRELKSYTPQLYINP